jgi:hypothetical protein
VGDLISLKRRIDPRPRVQSALRPPPTPRSVSFTLDQALAERLALEAGKVPVAPSEYARRLVTHMLELEVAPQGGAK